MMTILGINEVANPLVSGLPIILLLLSGYTLGKVFCFIFGSKQTTFSYFLAGAIIVNFVFIAGFIVFGVLTHYVKEYFEAYTLALVAFSLPAAYFISISIITNLKKFRLSQLRNLQPANIFSIILFGILCSYSSFVIYYHPVFLEYDFLYTYLPISKSIIFGNGLDHDYFTGSDTAIRAPPFNQAVYAWLLHSFGYSSMRLFPFYYVLVASLMVIYVTALIARTKDSFLPLLSASAFIITPAILVVMSRFSLQQELPFLLFLTASIAYFVDLATNNHFSRDKLMLLLICLSLMTLTREIGLVLSVAIFFLIPSVKFTSNNTFLRLLFVVLSLSPLYGLTFYDLFRIGFTPTVTIRLTTLVAVNGLVFYLVNQYRNQNSFKSLLSYSKYLLVLVIPTIFIGGNFLLLHGPYPTLSFSSEFASSIKYYREIFQIHDPLQLNIYQAISNLPRVDILFVSVAVGSIFLFYKLVGFGIIVYNLKNNNRYATILLLFLSILIIWSYLLNSGFEIAAIRHIAYFVPLMSIIFVVGMYRHDEPNYRLFYFAVMVLATFYFINYDVFTLIYDNHFGGFWIDPFNRSILNTQQFRLSAAVLAGLAVFWVIQEKFSARQTVFISNTARILIFGTLSSLLIYTLLSTGVSMTNIQALDTHPYNGWEEGVENVINYLNNAEDGNVLSLRAPAIPVFTDRNSYDIFSPHTISLVSPILHSENSSFLKEKLNDMGIKYIVFPNKRNQLYYLTANVQNKSDIIQIMDHDLQFRTVDVGTYNVTKLVQGEGVLNLIDTNKKWKPFGNARVFTGTNNMTISVSSHSPQQIFHRAFLDLHFDLNASRQMLLMLDYSTQSVGTQASFAVEIRNQNNTHLISALLPPTDGSIIKRSIMIPENLLTKDIEIRIYMTTNGVGDNSLVIHGAGITYS